MIAEKRKLFFFQQPAAMFNLTSRPGSATTKSCCCFGVTPGCRLRIAAPVTIAEKRKLSPFFFLFYLFFL